MDFQKLLLEADKALRRDEVKSLSFLCTDILGRNPNSVKSATDLFCRLADRDLLSPERPQLLTELLLTIQRPRLVRELGLAERTTSGLISPYRKLLYSLSEEITDSDLKDMKFLLKLPRKKLDECVTSLEVFLEMEHMDLISDTNLNQLEEIFQSVCPVLNEKINQFKALQIPRAAIITQETSRPRSSSCPFEPSQALPCLPRHSSLEIPDELQPLAASSMNSSSTSVDFHHGGDECQALVPGLSGLSTKTRSCASMNVTSDALKNTTSSDRQTPQTTDTNTEGLGSYPMTAAKRGVCLIVNNHNFRKSEGALRNREGTIVDKNRLHKVFEWLGFEVQIHDDCDKEEMLSLFVELSAKDHSQMDCVVCCVLSHGLEGGVYGVDGNTVKLRELMDRFDGRNCPSLAGKPKLFFIQACQGTSEQRPVDIESDSPAIDFICSDAVRANVSIPSSADFLLGMATVPSYVSYRGRQSGTWFIQSLCDNLVQMVPRGSDLVSILTKVNADVSAKTDYTGKKKQMPQPSFSLRKKVVFPVPDDSPPSLLH